MPSLIRHPRSGIFYIIRRINKKQVWKSLKTRDKFIAHTEYTKLLKITDPQFNSLLSNQIEEFLAHVSLRCGVKTCKIYRHALQHFLIVTGDISVTEVNERHFDKFVSETIKTVRNISANVQIRALKAFFSCLMRWKVLGSNPLEGAKQLHIAEKIPAYFSEEELKEYLQYIKDDRWLYDIVLFAVLTGARLGEIANLQWRDIDLINKRIIIRSSLSYQTKNGKIRTIPIHDTLWKNLSAKGEKEGFVFKGRKREAKAHLPFVSRQFKKSVSKGGFNGELHFHSLRHTFASLLVQKGVSLYHVQKLLGHSSPSMTEIYAHLGATELSGSIERLKLAV